MIAAAVPIALLAAACAPDGDDSVRPLDPTDARVLELESELDAANSRWLASVATSASMSPTDSRLLAVEALRRSDTVEAWTSLGQLLFADPRKRAETMTIPHGSSVNVVEFSPDSTLLATGADDGTIRLFAPGAEAPETTMRHADSILRLVFASNAPVIASASRDGSATVWTLDGDPVLEVAHAGQVNDVAISSDGSTVATASHDGTARITSDAAEVILEHSGEVWSIDITSNGAIVATGSVDEDGGVTTLWTRDGEQIAAFEHDDASTSVRFSADDALLVAAGAGMVGQLIDVEGATSIANPPAGIGFSGVSWQPTGDEFAIYGLSGAERFGARDGGGLGLLNQAGGERGIDFDPTGRWAVVGSGDFAFSFGSIGIWDLATSTNLVALSAGGPIESVAFSPDGTWVAAGFRFADGADVDGGLVLFRGPAEWINTACDGNDGIISLDRWVELVGPEEPFIPGCPGVEPPPSIDYPDVSTP